MRGDIDQSKSRPMQNSKFVESDGLTSKKIIYWIDYRLKRSVERLFPIEHTPHGHRCCESYFLNCEVVRVREVTREQRL